MRLVMTVDVDLEESGLNPVELNEEIGSFTRELLLMGAIDMEIGLTLQKVESDGVSWTRQ